jgi:hypothetical protein
MPDLSKQEIAVVVGIALVVLAASSLPYVLGYCCAPEGLEFGGFVVDLDDSFSYVAAMQQGIDGGWRYRVLFTPEDHPGAYLHTFYLALGKLSVPLGLSLLQMYHIGRLACGLLLLVTAYFFLSLFLESRAERMVAYSLVCFSSGLGWVVLLTGSTTLAGLSPLDFWLMDAYTFFTILAFPHSAAAVALLLLFLTLALRHIETPRLWTLIVGTVSLLFLCIIHPFTALLIDGILLTYWVLLGIHRRTVPGREGLSFAIWVLAPVPLIAYYQSAFIGDPVLANWSAQNILASPPITHLLLGYGILTPLALAGAIHLLREAQERRLLLVAWVVAALILLYVPFTLQRRMVEGLHMPLCVLATVGLFAYLVPLVMRSALAQRLARWRDYRSEGLQRLFLFSIIVATCPSNLYVIAGYGAAVSSHHPTLYYERNEVDAVDWLHEHTSATDTVLASYRIGRYVPARAGNRVFIGHFHETMHLEEKQRLADSFFQNTSGDDARRRLLSDYGIRYVFHGPAEKEMGGFDPSEASYLTRVYANESVAIYSVNL